MPRLKPLAGPARRPLILTLTLDAASFAFFNGLRRGHFRPERNVLPADVALVHHLPGDQQRAIREQLAEIASSHAPIPLARSPLL